MFQTWPALTEENLSQTRSGMHAFVKLLGAYAGACAYRRKHWWHINLKPVVNGFWTGVLQKNGKSFALALDFHSLSIEMTVAGEGIHEFSIQGESAASMQNKLSTALSRHSIKIESDESKIDTGHYEIDRGCASGLGRVYGQLAQVFAQFRISSC